MAADEVIEYIENGNIINSVNMAGAYIPRTGDPRMCVIHDNVPEMIAKITGAISSFGVNIEDMMNSGNKGRSPAYTILDISSVPDGLADAVKKIDGVARVRILP
jgi:D-3-phosphoglycerate dehydrogenase